MYLLLIAFVASRLHLAYQIAWIAWGPRVLQWLDDNQHWCY